MGQCRSPDESWGAGRRETVIDSLIKTSHRERGTIPQRKDKRLDSRRWKQPALNSGSRESWAFKFFKGGISVSGLLFPPCCCVCAKCKWGGGSPLDVSWSEWMLLQAFEYSVTFCSYFILSCSSNRVLSSHFSDSVLQRLSMKLSHIFFPAQKAVSKLERATEWYLLRKKFNKIWNWALVTKPVGV